MADILHRVGMRGTSPGQVYDALTTIDGLAGWWARDTSGDPQVDGVIEFRFSVDQAVPQGEIGMKVAELDPGRLVAWEVVDGPQEWIGTHVRFDVEQVDDWTVVMFKHEGWREQVPFMHHCSTKWATFLMSLKQLVETGTGAPDPQDVKISDWH